MIGGGKFKEGQEFTVATVQTLVKELVSLDYGMIIVDECHNAPCDQTYAVINAQRAKFRFGLSATPQRRDKLEFMLHAALGDVVARIEGDALDGAVLPVEIYCKTFKFKGKAETWQEYIQALESNEDRNRCIIESAVKSSKRTGTIILTSSIEHAEWLGVIAKHYGDREALVLHGQLSKKERDERMAQAPNSPLIIGTLSLLSEGIDWPHVGAIVFAAPVSGSVEEQRKVANRLIQSIGRARRPYPGKLKALVLDIIDDHPFGLSAWKKRKAIYEDQGFNINDLDKLRSC